MAYLFADCELDCERRELRRDGRAVHLEPQVFDVLIRLVTNRDRVVSKDELLQVIWNGRAVSDVSPTAMCRTSRSTRSCAIWRLWWTRLSWIASPSWGSRRERLSRCLCRSASAARVASHLVRRLRQGLGQARQRDRCCAGRGLDHVDPRRLGAGRTTRPPGRCSPR
jgi:hypothetical protein